MSVHTERDSPVGTIVMGGARCATRSILRTAEALVAEFETFNRHAQAKVAVSFGAHGRFCAGSDLKYGASLACKDVGRELNPDYPTVQCIAIIVLKEETSAHARVIQGPFR